MGGGDSRGANNVVNEGTFDDDLVAMCLGYYDVWGIDVSNAYFAGLVDSPLLYKFSWICFDANLLYMARVTWDIFVLSFFYM